MPGTGSDTERHVQALRDSIRREVVADVVVQLREAFEGVLQRLGAAPAPMSEKVTVRIEMDPIEEPEPRPVRPANAPDMPARLDPPSLSLPFGEPVPPPPRFTGKPKGRPPTRAPQVEALVAAGTEHPGEIAAALGCSFQAAKSALQKVRQRQRAAQAPAPSEEPRPASAPGEDPMAAIDDIIATLPPAPPSVVLPRARHMDAAPPDVSADVDDDEPADAPVWATLGRDVVKARLADELDALKPRWREIVEAVLADKGGRWDGIAARTCIPEREIRSAIIHVDHRLAGAADPILPQLLRAKRHRLTLDDLLPCPKCSYRGHAPDNCEREGLMDMGDLVSRREPNADLGY